MHSLRERLAASPILVRATPFAIFIVLGSLQGQFGDASRYWMYLVKTVAGALALWIVWPLIPEMRWRWSWQAIVVGLAVLVVWVGLDGLYPNTTELLAKLGLAGTRTVEAQAAAVWNPHLRFGEGTLLAWVFVAVRWAGSALVVPPLEEVFYRSFLYRYIGKADFLGVPLSRFLPRPFVITALLFGFTHEQWLAGILCGLAYQGVVLWKGRLGDAMVAHALTNALLALWIVWRGAWQFW